MAGTGPIETLRIHLTAETHLHTRNEVHLVGIPTQQLLLGTWPFQSTQVETVIYIRGRLAITLRKITKEL